ncbi:MAG: M56 family metallopeptidase [Peptococcaceae bacterium]
MSVLQDLFTTILEMSVTASYVALGVILIRLLLKKAPKLFSYLLWFPVFFRLVCPVSFAAAFSFLRLVNLNAQQGKGIMKFIPQNIGLLSMPAVQSGPAGINHTMDTLPQVLPAAGINPVEIWPAALSLIWIAGVIALSIYSIVSYVKIKRRLQTATLKADNVFETDAVDTAFVCGFIRPQIYVPLNIGDSDLTYILEHERTHIRRRDYLIKPLAFLALILHWFNPLMWLSFALMNRDLEMSCDESVLHKLGDNAKGGYSGSLLTLSVQKKEFFTVNPLAFGENHVKARIKNVVSYQRPALGLILIALAVVVTAFLVFTANPPETFDPEKTEAEVQNFSTGIIGGADGPTEIVIKPVNTAGLVAKALQTIMSLPQESSNPQDYIKAHQTEYDTILALDVKALPYLFTEFEKGGQRGLQGQIMAKLCKEILFEENIGYEAGDPQDWYDTYKAHVLRIHDLNSTKFIKNNYPKSYILLWVTGAAYDALPVEITWLKDGESNSLADYQILPNVWNGTIYDRAGYQQVFYQQFAEADGSPQIVPEGAKIIVSFFQNAPDEVSVTRDPFTFDRFPLHGSHPYTDLNISFATTADEDSAFYTFPLAYEDNAVLYYILNCRWENGNEVELAFAVQG